MLTGIPHTAHVFDDFAPTLTEQHRVLALTRRGFGNSSAPDSGYDFDRLAEDVAAVIDGLALEKPIVAGHSFAGEVMHILGVRYPSKVAGFVYIDAAFNRADDSADLDAKLRELPRNPGPQANDLLSIETLRDYRARVGVPGYPEAEDRFRLVIDSEGNITGQWQPAPGVQESYMRAMAELRMDYDPEPLSVPALALYAVPDAPEHLMRSWHDQDDISVQQTIEEIFVLARERFQRHARWFQSFAEASSGVIGIPGDHYLFMTNPSEVREAIEDFALSLE